MGKLARRRPGAAILPLPRPFASQHPRPLAFAPSLAHRTHSQHLRRPLVRRRLLRPDEHALACFRQLLLAAVHHHVKSTSHSNPLRRARPFLSGSLRRLLPSPSVSRRPMHAQRRRPAPARPRLLRHHLSHGQHARRPLLLALCLLLLRHVRPLARRLLLFQPHRRDHAQSTVGAQPLLGSLPIQHVLLRLRHSYRPGAQLLVVGAAVQLRPLVVRIAHSQRIWGPPRRRRRRRDVLAQVLAFLWPQQVLHVRRLRVPSRRFPRTRACGDAPRVLSAHLVLTTLSRSQPPVLCVSTARAAGTIL
mmetsp:Transcript_9113/g.28922  ORF Transcript_9113/g.28922 Transcript_9113/m.28922 type:complete len:304 (+) Transcript_9113:2790-3701(+)